MAKKWQSEDEIKAELRDLTDATRKVRRDLDDMVRGAETETDRRYLHRQGSPAIVGDQRKRKKAR